MNQTAPVILQADRMMGETRGLRTELRRRGARVLMAETVERALELGLAKPPDVILLDDGLNDASAVDLTEFFRAKFPSAEMIVLSSRPEDTTRGIGLGLLFHGLRPVSSATLLELVAGALPGRLSEPPQPPESKPSVLCVDDDRATLDSMSRLLGRHGYRVSTFEDPRQVLAAIPTVGPDVAVIDVLMPGMDGRQLTRLIREQYRGLFPIVMYSARSNAAERAAGFRHGADYFLSKPCAPHEILDVIDYYADRLDPEEREFLEHRL